MKGKADQKLTQLSRHCGSGGFSLPLVLMVVAICSVFVLGYLYIARTELGTTRSYVEGVKARYMALAAVDAAFADPAYLSGMRSNDLYSSVYSLVVNSGTISARSYIYSLETSWNSSQNYYSFTGACNGNIVTGLAYGLMNYVLVCAGANDANNVNYVSGLIVADYVANSGAVPSQSFRLGYLSRNLSGGQPGPDASWSLTNSSNYTVLLPSPLPAVLPHGSYYVDGSWNPSGTVSGDAAIYVNGVFSPMSGAVLSGNFVIIASGDATIDSCTMDRVLLIAGGNILVEQGANVTGAVLCFGSAAVSGNLNYNSILFVTFSEASDKSIYNMLKDFIRSIGEVQPQNW